MIKMEESQRLRTKCKYLEDDPKEKMKLWKSRRPVERWSKILEEEEVRKEIKERENGGRDLNAKLDYSSKLCSHIT